MGGGRKGLEVADYYNAIARGYDELYGDEQKRKYEKGKRFLPLSEKVLDAGCGTGLFALEVEGYYLGVDISLEMLRIAKNKLRNCYKDFVFGDVQMLPIRSKAFKACYSFTVLQNVEDPERTMEELKRCCKSFVISSLKGKGLKGERCTNVYPDVLCIFQEGELEGPHLGP